MAKRVKKRRTVEITDDNCKQMLLVYRFAGIIHTELSDMIKKAESIILKPIWKSE